MEILILPVGFLAGALIAKSISDAYTKTKNYNRGFKDGVAFSVKPLLQADKNLRTAYKEMPNGEVYVTLSLSKRG